MNSCMQCDISIALLKKKTLNANVHVYSVQPLQGKNEQNVDAKCTVGYVFNLR